MVKTISEINDKIRCGSVVVVTAEEIIGITREKGIKKAAREVDVVTTGTFSPMCFFRSVFQHQTTQRKDEARRRVDHAQRGPATQGWQQRTSTSVPQRSRTGSSKRQWPAGQVRYGGAM